MRRKGILGLTLGLLAIGTLTYRMAAAPVDAPVANAAMKGDKDAVRTLLKQAADVNAAQNDGMTALHWAAVNGDAELAQTLLFAGANLKATTRIGGYTPLFMAAKSGAAPVVEMLLKAGADPKAKVVTGLTPLMVAAMGGDRQTVRLLLESGADANAKESEHGQTALILAAGYNRADAIEELVKHGADINVATQVRPPISSGRGGAAAPAPAAAGAPQAAAGANGARGQRGAAPAAAANATPTAPAAQPAPQPAARAAVPPPAQQQDQLPQPAGNPAGGLNALMYASREGYVSAVGSLVNNGAKLDQLSGDKSTALLLATINGHYDVARYLVDHGADVNLASLDGAAPLFSTIHTQWSRESFHPQPPIKLEKTSYLELMADLLDHGANPNTKLTKVLWYSSYGFAYESASEIGTTPFWKCAEVADIDGMRLLHSRGADPTIPNKDGVNALLIASGAGTHGNDDVMAPPGRLAAVKYLVEELHFDVNAADNGATFRGEFAAPTPAGQPANPSAGPATDGFTAVHNAASRGDNAMILYLVSKGARVDVITKSGMSAIDMANGPRQRVQPYSSTIALLEMLGAKNNHKCVSC